MKYKVYLRTGWFLMWGFGLSFFLYLVKAGFEKMNLMDCLCIPFGIFGFGVFFFHSFYPLLTYDEDGLGTNFLTRRKQYYRWKDVKVIFRVSSDVTWMNTYEDKGPFLGGLMFTRHYWGHMARMINFALDKNSQTKIDPYILNQLEKKNLILKKFEEPS